MNESEISYFVDDATLYTSRNTIESVIRNLEEDLSNTLNWFRVNTITANPSTFQVILLWIGENPKLTVEIHCIATPP